MIMSTMIVTHTAAGTPVIELTPAEQAEYLEREVQSAVGMSRRSFERRVGGIQSATLNSFFADGSSLAPIHIVTPKLPLELVIRNLISD
jgi:hypothetical protein